MSLPTLKAQFDALLKLPSISCTQPALDQSNLAVVEQLASWFETLGEQGTIADALAKELGAVALRLKLDGPTLHGRPNAGSHP